MDLTDSRIASTIQNSPNWRAAVDDLLLLFARERRCYSSGELAAALRTHRPDFVFSVPSLGKYVREKFYAQELPEFIDSLIAPMQMARGVTDFSPVQVSRFTVGKYPDRTPAQTEVFVYGPDVESASAHEFEVFIPRPGESMQDAPPPAVDATSDTTGPGTPIHDAAVAIYGAQPAVKDIRATVWPDGRCCVPRSAFEAACHLGGTPIRQGEPVFVTVDPGNKATISLVDPGNGAAREYSLWNGQGRIAFTSPTAPLPPGTNYRVIVSAGEITVDLSNPL